MRNGPAAALVAVTAVWGSTFVVVKDAVERMPVTDFLTWRFAIGTLALLALRPASVARRQTSTTVGMIMGRRR